jgi:hypothetical protein
MPSLDNDIKVQQIIEDARFEDQQRVAVVRVSFMVGKHGPFFERFDKDKYTADLRNETLNRFARDVRTGPIPS